MSRVERDPERGRAVAAGLKGLGVKGILITAAEQGYITQLACKMPECFCPEELGGACYFVHSAEYSDWNPTHEHFPLPKKDGGRRTVDNSILAHRLCNRLDHSLREGRSHKRDLERIRKAREEAIRRNSADERSYPCAMDDAQQTKLSDRRSRLMHTLVLRWEPEVETWIYDDSEIGVFGEPFVSGADKVLTQLRAIQVGPGLDPFRVVFSASPFPGALEARRLNEEDGGVWFEATLGDHVLQGWLCAHFFDYFATAPPRVYVKAESLS